MEIFEQLSKLGYKHYVDLTIEELDILPIDNIEKRIEYSLVIDFFREKHNIHIYIDFYDDYVFGIKLPKEQYYNRYGSYEMKLKTYFKAREKAILKCIKLC